MLFVFRRGGTEECNFFSSITGPLCWTLDFASSPSLNVFELWLEWNAMLLRDSPQSSALFSFILDIVVFFFSGEKTRHRWILCESDESDLKVDFQELSSLKRGKNSRDARGPFILLFLGSRTKWSFLLRKKMNTCYDFAEKKIKKYNEYKVTIAMHIITSNHLQLSSNHLTQDTDDFFQRQSAYGRRHTITWTESKSGIAHWLKKTKNPLFTDLLTQLTHSLHASYYSLGSRILLVPELVGKW